ncbi:Ribonuclease D [Gammaproteobacteria bacterium]
MQTPQRCEDNLPRMADYIDTPEALNRLCAELGQSPFVALDTEFVREKTYLPRLCLIQVATTTVLAIVDPLALPDLSAFWKILQNSAITKVFHSGRQDLEIFYEHCGLITAPLFDTQLAATLLGHGDQIGYGALVEAECGINLDKAHTRTDWAVRPLNPGQLRYAADDVRYLASLYQHMRRRLKQDERLDWLNEDFAVLADPSSYGTPPIDAWKRVRGVQNLQGRPLILLQRLATWREQQARLEDRPRRWIIPDEVLLELVRHSPQNLENLGRIRGLDANMIRRYGHDLIALLRAVVEQPTSPSATFAPRQMLTSEQEALVDCLLAVVRLQSVAHGVGLATLASRRDLEALVRGESDLPLLHGWRRALVGQTVIDMLQSRAHLEVVGGRLLLGKQPPAQDVPQSQ